MTNSNDLSTVDVLEIIKACRKNGVAAFSHRGLKFRLMGDDGFSQPLRPQKRLSPAEEERRLPEMEMRLKQQDLGELRLRDPYEYEQLIEQQELTKENPDHDR